nr:hypothetical protein [Tanacetum cinerariifolium]
MNNKREHHTRAYLSSVEDNRARNVLPRNHRGCSRLQGEDANEAILKDILKKHGGVWAIGGWSNLGSSILDLSNFPPDGGDGVIRIMLYDLAKAQSAIKHQRQEESIVNAIRSWGMSGGSLQLLRETLAESSTFLNVDDDELNLGERNIKQCKRKICDGHYTATIRVLSSSCVAPYNEATLEDLKTKHPFQHTPSLPHIPTDHHHLIASSTMVLDRIKSFSRGMSCERDGLRAQHLMDCLSGFVVAVSDELVSSIIQVSAIKHQRQEESIVNAIRSWGMSGGSLQLLRETLAESSPTFSNVDDDELDLGERNIKQCKRKICDGHYTATIRVLSSSGVAPYNEATLEDLKTKHHFQHTPSLPHIPTNHHHLIASSTMVLDRIKSFSRGMSCERDGLRAQHLMDYLSGAVVAVSDELVSSIIQVVNLFLAENCPRCWASILLVLFSHRCNV